MMVTTTALALAIWAYLCIYDYIGPNFIMGFRPLISGFGAGILIGDVRMGMMIGGTLELMSLGLYTYGGATASVPDYTVGAILGAYFGNSLGFAGGFALAVGLALLLSRVDVLNRTLNRVFVHQADRYARAGNTRGFDLMMVFLSHVIWGLSRAIPVFLGVILGPAVVKPFAAFLEGNPWFGAGVAATAGMLPALGFAIVLKMLPVGRYPGFLLLGYVLSAYLRVPLVGVALVAVAVALVVHEVKYGATAEREKQAATGVKQTGSARAGHLRSFWRFIFFNQLGWNYERYMSLGYCFAMLPILKKTRPQPEAFKEAFAANLDLFVTSPIVGYPLIVGGHIRLEEDGMPLQTTQAFKSSLMGPMGGLGDILTYALYNTVVFGVGASMALEGRVLGPTLALLLVFFPYLAFRYWQFLWAYRQGVNLISQLAGGIIQRITELATLVTLIVVGGFVPAIAKLTVTLERAHLTAAEGTGILQAAMVQEAVESILPGMLAVLLTGLVYWLLKRKWSPVRVIGILTLIGMLGGGLGILG